MKSIAEELLGVNGTRCLKVLMCSFFWKKYHFNNDEESQSDVCFDFAEGLLTPPKPKKKEYGVRLPAKETHKVISYRRPHRVPKWQIY